ncbi:unannotated protein [freshwater metagenome]|uniref:Unannotated protein n=1 Tax=freshwater metagenome TaxID=449393 RepID=A0A6J6BQE7_9ZZZZ
MGQKSPPCAFEVHSHVVGSEKVGQGERTQVIHYVIALCLPPIAYDLSRYVSIRYIEP